MTKEEPEELVVLRARVEKLEEALDRIFHHRAASKWDARSMSNIACIALLYEAAEDDAPQTAIAAIRP